MWLIKKKKMLHLQHFYNKLQVVGCYWFKFEFNFFTLTITINNGKYLRGKRFARLTHMWLIKKKDATSTTFLQQITGG